MKFSSIPNALVALSNYAFRSEVKGTDYALICGVNSSLRLEDMKHRIAVSKVIITKIRDLLEPEEDVFFRFYYAWEDADNKVRSDILNEIGSLIYPEHEFTGTLAALKFRGCKSGFHTFAKLASISEKSSLPTAYRHIDTAETKMQEYVNKFTNPFEYLCIRLEKLLRKEELLY